MTKSGKDTQKNSILRCSKCFITLERLKKEGLSTVLIKVVDENNNEKYICRVCFEGW